MEGLSGNTKNFKSQSLWPSAPAGLVVGGRWAPRGCRCDWASVCQDIFTEVMCRKRQRPGPDRGAKRRKEEARQRDQDFYVPYRPKDFDSERG